jgi:hypothetical protein
MFGPGRLPHRPTRVLVPTSLNVWGTFLCMVPQVGNLASSPEAYLHCALKRGKLGSPTPVGPGDLSRRRAGRRILREHRRPEDSPSVTFIVLQFYKPPVNTPITVTHVGSADWLGWFDVHHRKSTDKSHVAGAKPRMVKPLMRLPCDRI